MRAARMQGKPAREGGRCLRDTRASALSRPLSPFVRARGLPSLIYLTYPKRRAANPEEILREV